MNRKAEETGAITVVVVVEVAWLSTERATQVGESVKVETVCVDYM